MQRAADMRIVVDDEHFFGKRGRHDENWKDVNSIAQF
jgi:hypothetical protein